MDVAELFNKLPEHIRDPNPERFLTDNVLICDFETSNLERGSPYNPKNRIVLAVWWYKGELKHKFGNEYEQQELINDCESADLVVASNAKFEQAWLRRCGLDIYTKLFYCTQVGDYVIAGNRRMGLSLEACAERRGLGQKGGLVSELIAMGICPSTLDQGVLLEYGEQDVLLSRGVFLKQRQELKDAGLLNVAYTRNLFTPVLADLESKGMHLDKGRVQTVYANTVKALAEKKAELDAITGGANTKSGPQMRQVMFKDMGFAFPKDYRGNYMLTETGIKKQRAGEIVDPFEYSQTGADAVAALKCKNKKQKRFQELYLEVNKLRDALSKYLTKFKDCCNEAGGMLYASFNQTFVATHRLSSTGKHYKTQLQNIDNDYKPLFSAQRHGQKVIEFDYRALEFVVASFLYADTQAIQDIRDKYDVHTWSASEINGIEKEKVTRQIRQDAKKFTFKPLYFGRSGTEGHKAYFKKFLERYPQIASGQQRWLNEAVTTKQFKTITGLKFYWPNAQLKGKSGWIQDSNDICNYPIQNFAGAEIVPIGITYLWHLLRVGEFQAFLMNTVHDSGLAEAPAEEVDSVLDIGQFALVECVIKYLDKVYGICFNIPLEIESKVSEYWSDTEQWQEKYLGAIST